MSEPIVFAVFERIPETNLGRLICVSAFYDGAFADADCSREKGFAVCVRKIAVDEARENRMIPGAFTGIDWSELPGREIWPGWPVKEGTE